MSFAEDLDAARQKILPDLRSMKQKKGAYAYSRHGARVDEIVLHGTESLGTERQSLDYLASSNGDFHSIHYWIGRSSGEIYAITPEESLTFHAGNPKKHPTVQDHNKRSIGIEMYQVDPAVTRKAGGTPDFTNWQYTAVAQLVCDICLRKGIGLDGVVGHGTINPIDRADPQGFDWDRFRQDLRFLMTRMTDSLARAGVA